MFPACLSSNSLPHWGNTCPKIAEHLRGKRSIAAKIRKDAHFVSNEKRQLDFHLQDTPKDDFVMPSIQGYNSWSYKSGKEWYMSHNVLDTGANDKEMALKKKIGSVKVVRVCLNTVSLTESCDRLAWTS